MIRRIFKWLGISLLSAVILGGSFAAHEWYAEKPLTFRAFLDRFMVKIAFSDPELLTNLGFLESMGITSHNAKLTDDSPERTDELFASIHQFHKTLNRYEDSNLDENQKLSKDLANYLLEFAIDFEKYRYHNYPVNQMMGIQSGFPSFMDGKHQVHSVEDAENYISRLTKLKTKFEQNLQGIKIREDKGIIPPKFVIQRVLDEMNAFISEPVEENILYASLERKLAKVKEASEQQRSQLLNDAKSAITTSVYSGYQLLIDYFTALKPKAGTDDGFWRLPEGDKAYELALRFFTTTDYSADKIHNMGLSEVDRIQAEMTAILASEGYNTSAGFIAAMDELHDDPKIYYPDTDEGRQQILKDYQIILDEINAGLDDAFRIRPKAGMEVVRIPEFKEKTAPGAYYEQPSKDGTRPGRFFANLHDIKATPKYGMRTLAYHEGIPGHHFQIAITMELEGVPIFRTIPLLSAFTEGWALYAEQLAWELGFETDPYDNLGRLKAELFRAVRLVVDTGLHSKRWTREEAIDYMMATTGMVESEVISEIERYIVLPGQATSYKVGMMKILELREKAKNALGDKFDLRDFHDVVLKDGAMPMDLLERIIDRYISATLDK